MQHHITQAYLEVVAEKNNTNNKLRSIAEKTQMHNKNMQDIFRAETIVNFSIKNLNRDHINYQLSKKNEEQDGIQAKSMEAELEEMKKTDNA